VYDARENDRVEAGIHAKAYRNMDNPNNAYSIGTAPSKDGFMAFAQQSAIQEAMKNAGVLAFQKLNSWKKPNSASAEFPLLSIP
jgi:hypothetical protein